jgi:hypothetical protein
MINISRYVFLGYNSASNAKFELIEAEVIPDGNSVNEKRKLDLAVKRYDSMKRQENIPLPGFTLFKTNRKNWGSVDQTWLIIDPRGFLVRISNKNLEDILHVSGITEGLIQEKCVWVRDDTSTKMILLPISSPTYATATKNTELIEGKVNIKDVQIGDTVILQNELQGIYMGMISLYGTPVSYSAKDEYRIQTFFRRGVIEVSPGIYHYQTDLKILKVIKPAEQLLTKEEAVAIMNKSIDSGNAFFTSGTDTSSKYFTPHELIKYASVHKVEKVPMTFEEIDFNEAKTLFDQAEAMRDFGVLVLENSQGKYLVDFYSHIFSVKKFTSNSFEICELRNEIHKTEKLLLKEEANSSSIFRSRNRLLDQYSLKDFDKYYKIVKHIKNEQYI